MPPVTLVAVRDTQARFGQRTTKKTVDCTKLIIIIIIITFLRFIDNNNGNMTKKSTKAEIKEVKKKHTTVQYCNVVVKDNNDLCYLKCDGRSYELEKKKCLNNTHTVVCLLRTGFMHFGEGRTEEKNN